MKTKSLFKFWVTLKKKISALLIVSLIVTGIAPAINVYAKDMTYRFIEELEVEETLIDDNMFYMPYTSLEVTEGDENNKYVFKVKRKSEDLKSEKVRLTMVDITGKYDRDYSIRVIDKAFFSENVKNKLKSKSASEYIAGSNYDEYNFSDAVVDGSILSEDIMTDEEKENFTFSEEDKEKVINDANTVFDEYDLGLSAERVDVANDEPETDHTVNGFSGSENESVGASEDVEKSESVGASSDEETTTEEITTSDVGASTASQENVGASTASPDKSTSEEQATTDIGASTASQENVGASIASPTEESTMEVTTTEESTTDVGASTASPDESTTEETATESNIKEIIDQETATTSEIENTTENTISTKSEIIYGTEEVKFIATKSSMSIIKGYEMATGLKDDRKRVLPARNAESILGINPNSLEDSAFMQDSIEVVEEELKSAYVILEFKEGQTEKLIEVTIINNKKYTGNRQVGFNLSSEEGSQVAGMYKSLTLIIHDDEEEEPTYINFTKTSYEPKDGYVTVEIERSGDLSSIATCMIDTEDITAKGGRDYSKVHAKLLFGLGVNKRVVKIPIVSIFTKKWNNNNI